MVEWSPISIQHLSKLIFWCYWWNASFISDARSFYISEWNVGNFHNTFHKQFDEASSLITRFSRQHKITPCANEQGKFDLFTENTTDYTNGSLLLCYREMFEKKYSLWHQFIFFHCVKEICEAKLITWVLNKNCLSARLLGTSLSHTGDGFRPKLFVDNI